MITRLLAFGAFWYDFIIGDDWRVAAGVVAALIATYSITKCTTLDVWWLVPVAIVIVLPLSLHRALRHR